MDLPPLARPCIRTGSAMWNGSSRPWKNSSWILRLNITYGSDSASPWPMALAKREGSIFSGSAGSTRGISTPSDQQYSRCLRSKGSGITLASFFHYAREAGIRCSGWEPEYDPTMEFSEDASSVWLIPPTGEAPEWAEIPEEGIGRISFPEAG